MNALGKLLSTKKGGVALSNQSCNSRAFLMLSKLPCASITEGTLVNQCSMGFDIGS